MRRVAERQVGSAPSVRYTVLVNSTDSFEDCWEPFFRLFSRYWPKPYPVTMLNTETKDFSYPGLCVFASRVGARSGRERLTWSESLALCLDDIETDLVLYMQEDYFIAGPVRADIIDNCVDVMLSEDVACIRIMECEGAGPWHQWNTDWLWEVDRRANYRISTQAALWRVSALRSHLRSHETPWQFEVWGSRRAWRKDDRILCLNREMFGDPSSQVIPYEPTGIVKGKWNETAVRRLFAENGIDVDFSVRGFYDAGQPTGSDLSFPVKVVSRIRSLF